MKLNGKKSEAKNRNITTGTNNLNLIILLLNI